MTQITLIAAVAENGCIGINNSMPWHLPEDFKFFRTYTAGKPVLMGRKTWESLPKKPLPNRRNIIITRQSDYSADGAELAASLAAAIALCRDEAEVMIIGGADIYNQAMPLATDLRLTEIAKAVDGDTFFPTVSSAEWIEQSRENHTSADGWPFAFVHYTRR